jgi:hypothetical protein
MYGMYDIVHSVVSEVITFASVIYFAEISHLSYICFNMESTNNIIAVLETWFK